ncbi:MAG: hypothetical protein COB22_03465 [Cycloclasticus sp.]|nr:MAG: hypothetical protein COB22_03465 [Cycloclasticus sp.]
MLNKDLILLCSRKPILSLLLALLTLFCTTLSFAGDKQNITVNAAMLTLQDSTYLLNAHIDYTLSNEAIDALENGVTLTFNVDVSIVEPRKWLWGKHINSIKLSYQIKHHTLAKTYQINDITNNVQHNFSSLSPALHAIGVLKDVPLHAISTLEGLDANVSIKAYLNIEALPLPMRPMAYITPGWHLKSNTYKWPLNR